MNAIAKKYILALDLEGEFLWKGLQENPIVRFIFKTTPAVGNKYYIPSGTSFINSHHPAVIFNRLRDIFK